MRARYIAVAADCWSGPSQVSLKPCDLVGRGDFGVCETRVCDMASSRIPPHRLAVLGLVPL